MTYWLYCRLNVRVTISDTAVRGALTRYANRHIKGGAAAVPAAVYDAVLEHHHNALALYRNVMRGTL